MISIFSGNDDNLGSSLYGGGGWLLWIYRLNEAQTKMRKVAKNIESSNPFYYDFSIFNQNFFTSVSSRLRMWYGDCIKHSRH